MFKIFVGNIGFDTTEEKLRKVFEPHLEIEDVVVARDGESGKSRGYGFVMTRDAIRGRRAIMQIGKFFIDGRLAYIKEAHGKKQRPKGRAAGRRVSHRPRPLRRRGVGGRGGRAGGGGNRSGTNGESHGAGREPGGYSSLAEERAARLTSRGYVGLEDEASGPGPGSPTEDDAKKPPPQSGNTR